MNIQLKKSKLHVNWKDKHEKSTISKPKSKHLETIESERILLIVDECIKNCCLVASFDSILADQEEFSLLLGRTLNCLFNAFSPVYAEFSDLSLRILAAKDELNSLCIDVETEDKKDAYTLPEGFWTTPIHELKRTEFNAMPTKSLFTETEIALFKDQLPEMEEKKLKMQSDIEFYVRSILIAFRNNPIATNIIIEHKNIWNIKRNLSLANLINYMKQLREILLKSLLTSPKERDERARFLATINRKQKQHKTVIMDLKGTLDTMKIDKEKMICQMNSEIIALQKEIYLQEIDGKNEIHKLEIKTNREMKEIKEAHEINKTNLTNDLNEIRTRYNELVEKNREIELHVRRRKWKLETETESWINKYDNEMSDYQLQYDKLKSDYDDEKVAFSELQTLFVPLEKEYIQVLEERRIAKEKEEAARSEHEALVYWATVIQSFWRAWKARKAMRRNRRR